MQITTISCPFKTSYGSYVESLKRAIEKKTGGTVQWVASNCGCGDPIELSRAFQVQGCQYFEMTNVGYYRSTKAWKRWLRMTLRSLTYYVRARKYAKLSNQAEVVHFHQILNAYGSDVVFHWLNQSSRAARVITIHELDERQLECPEKNKTYNKADAIIVHVMELKRKLISFGVDPDKIHIALHGTDLPAVDERQPREGIIFYGGHHLMSGKGLQTLFKAISLLKKQLGPKAPDLKVHGHFGTYIPEEAKQLAREQDVEDKIHWLNQLSMEEIVRQYQKSLMCVLPYTGSFAGLPAATAAATGLPVIATKNAGIPEHIGECGLWIDDDNPEQLAERIKELLESEELRRDVSRRLRKRAEQCLSWDSIADRTLEIYSQALRSKTGHRN